RWVSRLWGADGVNGGNGGNNNSLTEDELSAVFEIAGEEGVVDDEKGELLRSTIEFSEISAGEVLTPRVDMTAIDINAKMDEIMLIIDESRHSRLPVYDKNPDDIIGILYLNHFYKLAVGTPSALESPDTAVRPVLMEACFIHKNLKLPAVLNEFKRRRIQMAVVVDDYGGTMGIITMEDILEQLVGEIWDETDEIRREFREILPDEYEVDGSMSISDFYRLFDMDEDEEEQFPDYSSVGGWVIGMVNGFPSAGDAFVYKGLYVTVVEMDEHRVKKILVKVTGEEAPEQGTKGKGEGQEEERYE
ncbi:MAG: hemolysin family protein, partial [Eubacteriales bacterium]|nr:hemolysin family protein [Eubacteriales bacterium]